MEKSEAKILIIDDDADVLHTARMVLKPQYKNITTESNPQQIHFLLKNNEYEVILLDMNYTTGITTGKEGLRWLKEIKAQKPDQQVIMITAYGDIKLAVEAMKYGATDFVIKPWDNERLQATVFAAYQHSKSKKELQNLKSKQERLNGIISGSDEQIVGSSPALKEVFKIIEKVAPTDANILILGENGTGKELIAQAIHQRSGRKNNPFIKVDLGSIPNTLFESELFGHKKGAFTDAREDRSGRIELAEKGSLFLDEIGNVPVPMQAKLLTALQNKTITPLGSNKNIDVDCRIIAATNGDIKQMVVDKDFREDLLYRINTVELVLPPLRQRIEDIPELVKYFIQKFSARYRKQGLEIEKEAIKHLQEYQWPGNIRELQHAIERAIIMTDNNTLTPEDFILNTSNTSLPENSYKLDKMEKGAIEKALAKFHGNVSKAAKELGLGRTTIYRKMEKYGIQH